ncbi:hypothetical protein JYK00_02435 [Thermosipho ferrireducens]|uniref:Uncharacterized protein n=1 Tax=Thermosipho ferrireducens TaxID=2571116 RepID=A0ABX7SAF3_9BACT|nr:hypothetical protein [Thermosipho ferrireducens]QTA38401.1 hypothetical protein JYK00_02435 [Thermosipho ferrireducens]
MSRFWGDRGENISFVELIICIVIFAEIIFGAYMLLDATMSFYSYIKADYNDFLKTFHIVNYIRYDYYNRGVSEISVLNSKKISFQEILNKTFEVKRVTYQAITFYDTKEKKEKTILKRMVSKDYSNKGVNYFDPITGKITFSKDGSSCVIKTSIGEFSFPVNIPSREIILGISVKPIEN